MHLSPLLRWTMLFTAAAWRGRAFVRRAPLRLFADGNQAKRVVFLGTPEVAAGALEVLLSRQSPTSFEIVAAVTNPPARKGRGKTIVASPVGQLAEARGLACWTPATAKDEAFLDAMEALDVDLCITAAYGQYLPKRFLRTPRFGTLNVHPSLLPRWRGASPVQRSLEAGDAVTGVSVLFTVTKMDAGPVLAQAERRLEGNERGPELLTELFEIGTNLLVDALPAVFEGTAEPWEQDEAAATAAAKIDAADARCDPLSESAATLHNRARGFAGWPGTWLMLSIDGGEPQRFKFSHTRLGPGSGSGRELSVKEGAAQVVCGDGSILEIEMIQPPTKKMMPAAAWWNGVRGRTVEWVPAEAEAETKEGAPVKASS